MKDRKGKFGGETGGFYVVRQENVINNPLSESGFGGFKDGQDEKQNPI